MEEFLNCPICFERFSEETTVPLNLTCGHTVCRSCLQLMVASEEFKCPFDRTPQPNNLQSLPRNMPILYALNQKRPPENPCSLHPQKKLRFFCANCKVGFCSNCITKHQFHEWFDLENCTEKVCCELDKTISYLETQQSQISFNSQNFRNQLALLEGKKGRFVENVKYDFAKLKSLLLEKEKQILKDLEEKVYGIETEINLRIKQTEEHYAFKQSMLEKLKHIRSSLCENNITQTSQIVNIENLIIQAKTPETPCYYSLESEFCFPSQLKVKEVCKLIKQMGTRETSPALGRKQVRMPAAEDTPDCLKLKRIHKSFNHFLI